MASRLDEEALKSEKDEDEGKEPGATGCAPPRFFSCAHSDAFEQRGGANKPIKSINIYRIGGPAQTCAVQFTGVVNPAAASSDLSNTRMFTDIRNDVRLLVDVLPY